jgi:hypothetical protein
MTSTIVSKQYPAPIGEVMLQIGKEASENRIFISCVGHVVPTQFGLVAGEKTLCTAGGSRRPIAPIRLSESVVQSSMSSIHES